MTWQGLSDLATAQQLDIEIYAKTGDLPENPEEGEYAFVVENGSSYYYGEDEEGALSWQRTVPAEQFEFEYNPGNSNTVELLSRETGQTRIRAIEQEWRNNLRFDNLFLDSIAMDRDAVEDISKRRFVSKLFSKSPEAWKAFYVSATALEEIKSQEVSSLYFPVGREYLDRVSGVTTGDAGEVDPERFETTTSIILSQAAMNGIAYNDTEISFDDPDIGAIDNRNLAMDVISESTPATIKICENRDARDANYNTDVIGESKSAVAEIIQNNNTALNIMLRNPDGDYQYQEHHNSSHEIRKIGTEILTHDVTGWNLLWATRDQLGDPENDFATP